MNKKKQSLWLVVVVFFALYFFPQLKPLLQQSQSDQLQYLIDSKTSDQMVEVEAEVIKLLPDDNQGSRHQKFIVKTGDNTLLIAHNIDLADRVPLQKGDWVRIFGEYEWNSKGGVIHWTHRDKKKKHADGWIEHNNKKYQ